MTGNLPRLAVVTGASSGIGLELSRALSLRGLAVLAVARRAERLDDLAAEALAAGRAPIHALALDLTRDGAHLLVAAEARRLGVPSLLVNNAGLGAYGRFDEADPLRLTAMLRLNCEALVLCTHALLPDLAAAGDAAVLNVASAAGFQPTPFMSVYGATKAFVISFTEGLDEELQGSGVRALAFCPGPVATEFGEVAGVGERFREVPGTLTAEAAAAAALAQLDDREVVVVPGPWNKVTTTLSQFLPRSVVRRLSSQVLRPRKGSR
ncbi:MAG: SDR family NAD(P)-dependent oxidoreductase [Anaeromyxobacter sp.]|nr:SDR family NAD(P)-dependent oxidoreductase [Anaeromyxobacter sp.]MBL0275189.1 SDR family NAD(P)-dependent oxidoreductase [Anaeromyxobacter sp.]